MANMITRTIASAAERALSTTYLWGHTGSAPAADRRIAMSDMVFKDASGNIVTPSGGFAIDGFFFTAGKTGSGSGGNFRSVHDGGTLQWVAGILGAVGARNYSIYNNITSKSIVEIQPAGNVGIGMTSIPSGRRLSLYGNQTTDAATALALCNSVSGTSGTDGFSMELDGVTGYLWNYEAGALLFGTSNTERFRVAANGDMVAGRTSVPAGFGAETEGSFGWAAGANSYFAVNNAGANGAMYISRRSAASSLLISFATQGTQTGTITTNGTTTTYNTTSDYRLKDEIEDLTDSGDFIDALRPRKWNWKFDGSPDAGFIAHEFAVVSPSSVNGEKDAMRQRIVVNEQTGDEEEIEEPAYQSMQASSPEVMAHVILELQSLRARVAALESAAS